MTDNACVKVVVRIRPQISRDIVDLCHVCTTVVPNEPQIWLGKDKAFTFDEVFDMPTTQCEIYDRCVKDLVEGCLDGYNATVLAYGQTGSGKTYTMGTGFDLSLNHPERGIIPRAVEHLFQEIAHRQADAREQDHTPPEFKVNAQFMELYNEEIIDLLDSSRVSDDKGKKAHIKIHEDSEGQIYTVGVIAQCVTSVDEALQVLKLGSLSRTTASTGMNLQSSRSHAIFTLHIKQQRVVKLMPLNEESCNSVDHQHTDGLSEFETLTAKFHFVDLAGSERLKRTGATGERQKEGISINSGLLALGNVISALGDKSRKITHVPYRDSKLTRLLQDSLGGNSRTLMIACISPSDRDFMETLNTLKYANRAKNIKNKITVNMDKTSQTISMLRQEVENLKLELLEYKQGKRIVGEDGTECVNDMYHENTMLQAENNTLKTRVKALQETVERLTVKNTELLAEKAAGNWIVPEKGTSEIAPVIQEYIREIETLRAKLLESEEVCCYLRKHYNKSVSRLSASPTSTVAMTGSYDIRMDSPPSVYELLEEAKEDVRQLKKKKRRIKISSMEKKSKGSGDGDEENEKEVNEKDVCEKDEGNEEEEEDIIDESTSDTDFEQENYSENLAGLTCEISMKERLIQQVEMSQRRLQNMRQRYEEKIIQLQNRIQETERERDKFLSSMSKGTGNQPSDKALKVNEDFEKKLCALKNDMRQMQAAKKEHTQVLKNQSEYERQLKMLRHEVAEMKKAKVALLNKMKEEAKKHKEAEQKKSREIAQLKRDGRNKETQIRTLQAEKRLKEAVLKRKQEEVIALRKRTKSMMSKKPASHARTSVYSRSNVFSPKLAKQKWQSLEKKITKLVLNRLSMYNIEKDMERWLQEREKLSRCYDKLRRKLDRALIEMHNENELAELREEMESLQANIDYIYENISDCQTSIVQLEETKDGMDAVDIANSLKNMQLEESKYLIEKLLNMAINQSLQAAQREIAVRELEAQLKQVIENNAIQEQLLLHVVHQANENISGMIDSNFIAQEAAEAFETTESSAPLSPIDSALENERKQTYVVDSPRKKKARELTTTAEELLFSGNARQGVSDSRKVTQFLDKHDPLLDFPSKPSEAVISWKQKDNEQFCDTSFALSAMLSRDVEEFEEVLESFHPDNNAVDGWMIPFHMKSDRTQTGVYLMCTYVAEGHTQAVVGLECTSDVLFSSSKDRTVKVWDLTTGKHIQQLTGHPSTAARVRYCEYTRLAFTASKSYIMAWDIRQNPSLCVHTMSSSGVSADGTLPQSTLYRRGYNSGEHRVNDIALNHYGTTLFSASTSNIRMWDLRMFQSVGALNAGFQSIINCLAVDEMGLDKNIVISGSKECSIKVFEVMEGSRGIHAPLTTLVPPHYDSIEDLCLNGDMLFSASKDSFIKKWDLRRGICVDSLRRDHKDAVCAVSVLPSGGLLLSGCQSGYLSLWSADTCEMLEELRAHGSAINAIASNEKCMFTASSDSTVGIWMLNDRSCTSPLEQEFENLNLMS